MVASLALLSRSPTWALDGMKKQSGRGVWGLFTSTAPGHQGKCTSAALGMEGGLCRDNPSFVLQLLSKHLLTKASSAETL